MWKNRTSQNRSFHSKFQIQRTSFHHSHNGYFFHVKNLTLVLEGVSVLIPVNENKRIAVSLIDIPSGDKHFILLQDAIKLADAFLLIYEISKKETIVKDYIQQVSPMLREINEKKKMTGVILGNVKSRIVKRYISSEFGYQIARSLLKETVLPYYEFSVKEEDSVVEMFSRLISETSKLKLETQTKKLKESKKT